MLSAWVNVAAVDTENGRPMRLSGVVIDLTDRKRLEEQFQQAQKMEAVGQLAGGVAHDFNNLLTIITGYSEMLLASANPESPDRELLDEIRVAAERAAGLTRQLLAFSRKGVLEPRIIDLNEVVQHADKMLRRLIGEDVGLALALTTGLGHVKVDPGQVEQVLMNLAVNARDAMPTGGKLTIETVEIELDEEYASTHPEVWPGRYVLLSVSDTGMGMDAATKARIFEPFFTTKELGKGTGLGLAVVHGFVKQSGGHVAVYSEPRVGTTFKIYLPAVEGWNQTGWVHPRASSVPRGAETVLLVEDEEAVRRLSSRALRDAGYTVLEAVHGGEAVRLAEDYGGPIHAMVSDVVMPEMGGRILAERLTAGRPGLKSLFVSGYTDDAVVRHGVLAAEVAFFQKPFTPAALAAQVAGSVGPLRDSRPTGHRVHDSHRATNRLAIARKGPRCVGVFDRCQRLPECRTKAMTERPCADPNSRHRHQAPANRVARSVAASRLACETRGTTPLRRTLSCSLQRTDGGVRGGRDTRRTRVPSTSSPPL